MPPVPKKAGRLRSDGGETRPSPYSRRERGSRRKPGLINGIFSFLASIGLTNSEPDFESDSETSHSDADIEGVEEDEQNGDAQAGASNVPLQPPPSSSSLHLDLNETTLLEWASRKVNDRTPMNEMELRGLQALLESKNDRTYEPERLRFSSRPLSDVSRSPGADSDTSAGTAESRRSGFSGTSTLPTFTNNVNPSSSANSTRRMLKKDPNGDIKWRGAGRSRSTSAHSRRVPNDNVLRAFTSEASKRRKVTEETAEPEPVTPSTSPSSNGPASSTGLAPKQDYVKKATNIGARIRTAPAVSSPLRNAITASPPASPPTSGKSATSTTASQTKAASFLSAIVEKATPPPKPDIANPYEIAAPIKPTVKPKIKMKLNDRKRAFEEEEKARETGPATTRKESLSAKSIIEATVPKGAKRSLPPPGIGKSPSPGVTNAAENYSVKSSPPKKFRATVEDAPEDDDAVETELIEPQDSGPFADKPANSMENNVSVGSKKTAGAQSAAPLFKSSTPKEPSKLRNTIIATDDSENENPSPATFGIPPAVNGVKPMAPASTNTNSLYHGPDRIVAAEWAHDPKGYAMVFGDMDLPVYNLHTIKPAEKYDDKVAKEARAFALKVPESKLPKFDFSGCEKSAGPSSNSNAAPSAPKPAVKGFDFAAAGMKPLAGPKDGEWECSTCMLKNPASAADKCQTCESPRPGAKKAPVAAFDWSAAGMKPLAGLKDGEWECGTCMLKNPASATEKCSTCEAPKPGAKKAAATPSFNWAASGMKMATKPAGGEWTCGTCMLQNPATAVAKCTVCESPR